MKKTVLWILPLLTLTGCSSNNINVLTPSGAPAVAFYNWSTRNDFTTNSVPSNIVASMVSSSKYTVVVVDTASGIKAIKNGAKYKIGATITFGNFFLAGTGNDKNKTLDYTDSIVLFGSTNAVPYLLFNYIYDASKYTNIKFVDSVSDSKRILETGKMLDNTPIDYTFIAQPALYSSLKKNQDAYVLDNIQTKYKEKTTDGLIMQASVFIKDTLPKDVAANFLATLNTDINSALSNPSLIEEEMSKIGDATKEAQKYGVSGAVAKAVTQDNNGMGLGFKNAYENKMDIDRFISLFGMEATDEKIYFK